MFDPGTGKGTLPLRPVDVATHETVGFIQNYLPPGAVRILEVGCGRGEVALQLKENGHQLIAIDSDAGVVEQARNRGIDARVARWPEFEEAAFDAILFTRSLHHIVPLTAALNHARRLLLPSGVLLVEDFAYEAIDHRTSEWCYSLAVLLKGCGEFQNTEGFLPGFIENEGDPGYWHNQHDHELHTSLTISTELKQVFSQVSESQTAYLYRYFLPVLSETQQGYLIASHLLELERRMGEAGGIELIGRRFIAYKQN